MDLVDHAGNRRTAAGMTMDTFKASSKDERRTYCNKAQAVLRLPPASIEKDFWVCWTLRELFDLPITLADF